MKNSIYTNGTAIKNGQVFWNQYNSKNQNNMSTHLTIKNENRPNPRTATSVREKGVLVAGDMICFVVKSENLMKRGLWSRLGVLVVPYININNYTKFWVSIEIWLSW